MTTELDAVSENAAADTGLQIGNRRLQSRLVLGTGRYDNLEMMRASIDASGSPQERS